jgi:hypothetical protein
MNSDMARMLLSKIFEKQSDNPYFPAVGGSFPPIFDGAAVRNNQSNPSVYDIAQALLATNNENPLGNAVLLGPAGLNVQNNLNAEAQRIKKLFEEREAKQEIADRTGVGPDGKPKIFDVWSDEGVRLRRAAEAKAKNPDMQGLPEFKPPFRGNHELDNLPTSHPGPPKTQVTPNVQNNAATGLTAPQTVPPPPRGAGAPPFITSATNAIADTLKSWGQSVTNNVTPKNISSVIGAPMAALTGSKPSETNGTSGTSSAPTPTLASKNDAGVKAWYENDMVRRAALLGLAGGAGLGGVYALSKMFNKPKPKSKINRNFDFTYPVERIKESGEQGWSNYLFGTNERTPSILDNPLLLSTLALAGGGGLLGGYKGTQLLTDAVLKKTHDDERKKAERDFHDALLSSYASPLSHDPHVKKSSTATMTEVGQALDSLYSTLTQKVAEYPGVSTGSAVNDVLAGLPALYLLYAGASGLGTGALAYDYTRKGSKAEALKRALRERDSARYEHAPPELYATAEPIDISRPVSRKEQRSAVV